MPCYYPLYGYKSKITTPNGKRKLAFTAQSGFTDLKMSVPCGKCIGCRIDRSRMWALRCAHEAKLHLENCFITLTYNPENLPEDTGLVKKHLQDFFRRMRKNVGNFRYFACGEYGEKDGRPHYHAIIFGLSFNSDRKFFKKSPAGYDLFISKQLQDQWPFGFASVSPFSYTAAAYTARYILKKVGGSNANNHYQRLNLRTGELSLVTPEFALMSLKPGIGHGWWEKYKGDAFPSDFLVHDGKKHVVPRYYTNLLKKEDSASHGKIILKRKRAMKAMAHDNTPDRLYVKEEVKLSKIKQLSRS